MIVRRSCFPRLGTLLAGLLLVAGPPEALAQRGRTNSGRDALTPHLELMLRSIRLAREWHLERPSKRRLLDDAIEGLMAGLGPEAEYYSQSQYTGLSGAKGEADVGLEVRREAAPRRGARPGYRVVSSRDGSAAAHAGLSAGDLVTHVGAQAAGEVPHAILTRALLAGNPGRRVTIVVKRRGGSVAETMALSVERRGPGDVAFAEPEPGVVWIRPAAMIAPVATRTVDAIRAARQRLGAGLTGFVLDLRGIAGGDMVEAAKLASQLAHRGGIFSVAGRRTTTFERLPIGDAAEGRPLIVLIDAGTAGPAEGIAISLQASGRARIAGIKSAGRGAVYDLLPLGRKGERGAIRIPTGRIVSPSGAPIDGRGVVPDAEVAQAPPDAACRGVDVSGSGRAHTCRRRALSEDGQLRQAIALLRETLTANSLVKTAPDAERRPERPANAAPLRETR